MQHLAEEVARELELAASEKSIDLKLDLPKISCSVKTDNLLAKEILINLLGNAVKYTPDGGNVSLRLRNRTDSAIFTVTDTGIGIPAYSQEHIFTKFFRAQNVIKRETTGTGLGLYLVKGLAEALGGKVWFTSEENVGSKFYFSLPKKAVVARPSDAKVAKT
jgi:signal transduction histidine kinase